MWMLEHLTLFQSLATKVTALEKQKKKKKESRVHLLVNLLSYFRWAPLICPILLHVCVPHLQG